MMKRSGTADLPLHYGKVPPWLAERMIKEERNNSWRYGGRTVFGKAQPPLQQDLFNQKS